MSRVYAEYTKALAIIENRGFFKKINRLLSIFRKFKIAFGSVYQSVQVVVQNYTRMAARKKGDGLKGTLVLVCVVYISVLVSPKHRYFSVPCRQ